MDGPVEKLLQDMIRMTAEGARAAATRLEHLRWTAMAAKVRELEDELR